MSGRGSELPVSNPEGQETGKKQGKERARTMQLDVTRQVAQTGDKRTREQQSPTDASPKKKMTRQEVGWAGGKALYEQGKGIHGMTTEQRQEVGRASYEQGKGIHGMTTEQRQEVGRALYEQGKGVHGMTTEQLQEVGRAGGKASYEQGKGVHGMTIKQRQEAGRAGQEAKIKKHVVSMRNQNDMANRAAGYKPPKWATGEASGSGP
jgi:hypothetical protein